MATRVENQYGEHRKQIEKDGVRPAESNLASLFDIPSPSSTKQLHFFISTENYYLKFVPMFAELAEPLRQLLLKDVNWN